MLAGLQKASRRRNGRVCNILIDSLTKRWQRYLKELHRCKRGLSEAAVHDLRVATRRMISTLMMIGIVLPDARVRRLERRLKRLFDALSPLRDTQVQLLKLASETAAYPELETLITVLKVRERNLMKSLERRLLKLPTRTMGRMVSNLKRVLGEHFSRPRMHDVGLQALVGTASARFMTAVAFNARVGASRPRTIHRARVAFKKFRYTCEALSPMLPWLSKNQMKAMDAFQTRMGNIQDGEVLRALVDTFARKRPLQSRRKLSGFQRSLRQQQRERIAEFVHSANELFSFYRRLTPSHKNRHN